MSVAHIYKNSSLRQGLEKMRAHGYQALPVLTEEGEYYGSVTEGDFLWQILENGDEGGKLSRLESVRVADIVRPELNRAVRINAGMSELLDLVAGQNFVPVVDDRNMFMGIVTRKDVLNYFRGLVSQEDRAVEFKREVS